MPSPPAKACFAQKKSRTLHVSLMLLLPLFGVLTSCSQREHLVRSIEATKREIELAERRADDLAEEEHKLEGEVLADINNFALAGNSKSSAITHNSARIVMARVMEELTQEAADARKHHKSATTTLEKVRADFAAYRAHVTANAAVLAPPSAPQTDNAPAAAAAAPR